MRHPRRRSYGHLISTTAVAAVLLASTPLILADLGIPGTGHQAQAESCCFTGETLVLMADGRQKPIATVVPGDMVTSGSGRPSRVMAVERVPLGGRRLYAVNETEPFFTREHPFLTRGGWRSVSPEATGRETPSLQVGELALGDLMVMAQPGIAEIGATALAQGLARRLVPLIRIWSVPAAADLIVHNLFLDGDHTYVANGFIVHNKGGEGGEGGGGSDGGEGGGSGSGGGGSGASGSGDDGGESGSEDGVDDGGESGSSGSGSGHSGGESGFKGSSQPAGRDLTREEERNLISRGWK